MSLHKLVFNQQIWNFFKWDIESCLRVVKMRSAFDLKNGDNILPGGLNFTAALVIFCVIEMMTGYYKGKLLPSSDDVTDFLAKYFSKYESLFSNKEFSKRFYEVFRHGLVHEWSPKWSAVGMDFSSIESIGILKITDNREIVALNVPIFYDITIKALNDYEKDLDNGCYVSEFKKRYNEAIKKDSEEMELLKLKFLELKKRNNN